MTIKICYSCAVEKPCDEFHRHRGRKDGRNDVCKLCANKRVSLYAKTDGAKAAREKFFSQYKERDDSRQRLQDYHREYNGNLTAEQRAKYTETRRKRARSSPRKAFYQMLYAAAKRRPTKDIATVDDLMEMFNLQEGRCAVSGMEMDWASNRGGKKLPTSMSLDRIDGNRGYEKNNLRLVCWQVNLFKNCWNDDQMLAMALAIVANMKRPKLRLVS